MKWCSECESLLGIQTPAEYMQEWRVGASTVIFLDCPTCEEHMFCDTDKNMIAKGFRLTMKRLD